MQAEDPPTSPLAIIARLASTIDHATQRDALEVLQNVCHQASAKPLMARLVAPLLLESTPSKIKVGLLSPVLHARWQESGATKS